MSDRQKLLSRLISDKEFRADYIRAKLDVLIPSQLRALRLREEKTQSELAQLAEMRQARISAMETPGAVNFNRETLVRMAATHNVGLIVKFVPLSEMLEWENSYSQDAFSPTRLADGIPFLRPARRVIRTRIRKRKQSLTQTQVLRAVGGLGVSTLTDQQEGTQLGLRFKQSESSQDSNNHVNLIGNSSGHVPARNYPEIREAAATAGGQSNAVWRSNVA